MLGATNRPEVLDKALLRPGRFDRRITVDRPNLAGRLATLQVHTRNIRLSEDVNLEKIAAATAGCVGADLANLVNEAALRAVRMGRQAVNQNDLLASFEMVIAGAEKKGTVLTEKEKKLIAYHEVGHALVAARQKNTQPVSKITIVPHTQGALGYTMQTPEEEKFLEDREELLADLRTLLGGRAAEWAVFHTMTTGASNDIERATDLARKMVTMYGMSDRFGVMGLATIQNQYLDGSAGMNCAEATAAQVDEEVRKLIDDAYHDAVKMLEDDREMLDKIAAYLLEKETITGQEMMAILEGRDPALVDNYGATPEEPRKRRLDGDVEPPARSVHMISEPPVNPFVQPSEDAQDEDQAPDAEGGCACERQCRSRRRTAGRYHSRQRTVINGKRPVPYGTGRLCSSQAHSVLPPAGGKKTKIMKRGGIHFRLFFTSRLKGADFSHSESRCPWGAALLLKPAKPVLKKECVSIFPVRRDHLTGDELRAIGAQIAHAAGHLIGSADAPQRGLLGQRLHILLGEVGVHVGVDDAGGDAVDTDIGGADLLGQRLGKGDDRALAGGIGHLAAAADLPPTWSSW